jgi:peptidoglycan endopeptidase LytE
MNNPNPFLPQGSFLEQKNKARTRVKIAVYFSISLSVVALMALLIQGCRKPNDTAETGAETNSVPELPTNPPDMSAASNTAMTPAPETNLPAPVPAPSAPVYTPPPAPATEDYTVIKGDTFASIAKKSNVSVKAMVEANPGVDAKKLKIGQKLHVPAATAAPVMGTTPLTTPEPMSAGGEQTYKVKSGDTLTSIAKHFHVTIKAIQSANSLGTTSIKVGQTLKIPASAAPAPAPAPVETMPPPVGTPSPAPATPPAGH